MVGCCFAHEIWSRVETHFALQTRAKIKQLKTQLKEIKKQGLPALEYLLKIKKVVDSLVVVGSPLSVDDHIEVIIYGLNEDYATFITTVLSRLVPFLISEIEASLMA